MPESWIPPYEEPPLLSEEEEAGISLGVIFIVVFFVVFFYFSYFYGKTHIAKAIKKYSETFTPPELQVIDTPAIESNDVEEGHEYTQYFLGDTIEETPVHFDPVLIARESRLADVPSQDLQIVTDYVINYEAEAEENARRKERRTNWFNYPKKIIPGEAEEEETKEEVIEEDPVEDIVIEEVVEEEEEEEEEVVVVPPPVRPTRPSHTKTIQLDIPAPTDYKSAKAYMIAKSTAKAVGSDYKFKPPGLSTTIKDRGDEETEEDDEGAGVPHPGVPKRSKKPINVQTEKFTRDTVMDLPIRKPVQRKPSLMIKSGKRAMNGKSSRVERITVPGVISSPGLTREWSFSDADNVEGEGEMRSFRSSTSIAVSASGTALSELDAPLLPEDQAIVDSVTTEVYDLDKKLQIIKKLLENIRFDTLKEGIIIPSIEEDTEDSVHATLEKVKLQLREVHVANDLVFDQLTSEFAKIPDGKRRKEPLKLLLIANKSAAETMELAVCTYQSGRLHASHGIRSVSTKHSTGTTTVSAARPSTSPMEQSTTGMDILNGDGRSGSPMRVIIANVDLDPRIPSERAQTSGRHMMYKAKAKSVGFASFKAGLSSSSKGSASSLRHDGSGTLSPGASMRDMHKGDDSPSATAGWMNVEEEEVMEDVEVLKQRALKTPEELVAEAKVAAEIALINAFQPEVDVFDSRLAGVQDLLDSVHFESIKNDTVVDSTADNDAVNTVLDRAKNELRTFTSANDSLFDRVTSLKVARTAVNKGHTDTLKRQLFSSRSAAEQLDLEVSKYQTQMTKAKQRALENRPTYSDTRMGVSGIMDFFDTAAKKAEAAAGVVSQAGTPAAAISRKNTSRSTLLRGSLFFRGEHSEEKKGRRDTSLSAAHLAAVKHTQEEIIMQAKSQRERIALVRAQTAAAAERASHTAPFVSSHTAADDEGEGRKSTLPSKRPSLDGGLPTTSPSKVKGSTQQANDDTAAPRSSSAPDDVSSTMEVGALKLDFTGTFDYSLFNNDESKDASSPGNLGIAYNPMNPKDHKKGQEKGVYGLGGGGPTGSQEMMSIQSIEEVRQKPSTSTDKRTLSQSSIATSDSSLTTSLSTANLIMRLPMRVKNSKRSRSRIVPTTPGTRSGLSGSLLDAAMAEREGRQQNGD